MNLKIQSVRGEERSLAVHVKVFRNSKQDQTQNVTNTVCEFQMTLRLPFLSVSNPYLTHVLLLISHPFFLLAFFLVPQHDCFHTKEPIVVFSAGAGQLVEIQLECERGFMVKKAPIGQGYAH